MAQMDACLTGDQEVVGYIPAGSDNILSWRLIMKYFLRSFSPFCWFKKGSCRFLAKEYAQILVNCLVDKACAVKVWLGQLTGSAWRQWIDWAVKPQLNKKKKLPRSIDIFIPTQIHKNLL